MRCRLGFYVTRPTRQGGLSRTLCLYTFYFVPTSANAAYMILCSCIATLQIPLAFEWVSYPVYLQGIVLLTLIVIAGRTLDSLSSYNP